MKKTFILSIVVALLLPILTIISYPFYQDVNLVLDTGASVYQWMSVTPNIYNTWIIICLFLAHLLFNLFNIMKIKQERVVGYTKYNSYLLVGNLIFILLHQLQTNIGYDGLAVLFPVWTSQLSVIIMLCVIIVMLIPRRGIILGLKIPVNAKVIKFLYMTHGILFLVALVYTFWYHPMVFTYGHLTGFIYMFLLFVQIGFTNTRYHTNPMWILILEVAVVVHGVSVAYLVQESMIWPMFLWGFLFMFAFTQVYILKIAKKWKYLITTTYLFLAILFYLNRDITMIHQILWIPIIEYGVSLLIVGVLSLYYRLKSKKGV